MGPIIISRDWLPSHTQTDGQTDGQRDRGLSALLDRRLTYHLHHRPTGVRPARRDSRSNRAARQPVNYIDKTAPVRPATLLPGRLYAWGICTEGNSHSYSGLE